MKYSILLMFLILLIMLSTPLILADTIEDTTITIKIYNNTIEIISSEYSGNNRNETLSITEFDENHSEIASNGTIKFKEFSFPLIFIRNESVSLDTVEKYVICLNEKTKCLEEKASFNTAWTRCVVDLAEYEGENFTSCKEELDTCILSAKEKDLILSSKNDEVRNLEEEKDDTKNKKYFWGFGGLAIGIIGLLFYQRKIGKGVVKEKSMEEHSKTQAG